MLDTQVKIKQVLANMESLNPQYGSQEYQAGFAHALNMARIAMGVWFSEEINEQEAAA
jgi:hypothetical protein